jgi:ABC-type antimicrobial peptide transport system permease subunit
MAQAAAAAELTFQQSLEADLDIADSTVYIKALEGSRGMTEARSEIVRPLMTVGAVVVAVLLIACVNLANLLLARAGTRGREIAVRVMREMTTVSIGAGLGLFGSYFAVRGLESQLYGLEATDPATMVGAAGVLLLVAAIAAFVPARQAATLDPVEALRNE